MNCDAVVVGAGPNGLAAAITLAQAGKSVIVYEAKDNIGGGCRSAELTLPGFVHDVCSAVHPLGLASPFFRTLPLDAHGVEWIHPPTPLAHPFDDGTAALLERSIAATGETLAEDAMAYRSLIEPLATNWQALMHEFLGPLRVPRHPLVMARFGLRAIRSARGLAQSQFKGERARALFAGMAAHSMMPLTQAPTAAFGLMLAVLGHAVGWPIARGGSQSIVNALAEILRALGGEIITSAPVTGMDDLPDARATLFDVTPLQLKRIAGDRFPAWYQDALGGYRYGPGLCKVDYALDSPIPWKAPACRRAGTVHLGGTLREIQASEQEVWEDKRPTQPFVLLAQQSLFDCTRAPAGKHTAWAYCHVPHGSTDDMTKPIEAQIERFAPGFRDRILARHTHTAVQLEQYNANYIGGDINGGVQDFRQLFTRPALHFPPYATPNRSLFICSSSTPPGGGVHGMCGYHAARTVLPKLRKR